jgi:tetratricopeptide (TPR) repeat protein
MKQSILKTLKISLLSVSILAGYPLGFATAELSQTVNETGLSGSFLASRIALEDNDDEAAVQFLGRAASLDPDNGPLIQDYFVALVANGQIEAAADIVRKAESMGARKNLAGYVLAAEEMRKRSWNKAATALKDVAGVDLDRTLREITLAWVNAGERNFEEAQVRINDLTGPEWIQAMKNYHQGLIAILAGEDETAVKHLQAVVDNRAVVAVLTETYVRALEAMIRLNVKSGKLDQAKESLEYGRSLLPNHSPFNRLAKQIEDGEVPSNLIVTPQQGAAELFFNVASAIERDGIGEIAKSYLQIANHMAPKSDVIQVGLAELYLRQGFYERSNTFYNKIGEASPFYRIGRLEVASNLARLEQKNEAIDELRILIENNPQDLSGYMTLGALFNREKRYQEAADIYDAAVDIIGEPQRFHWNLFFRRGIAYERLKQWDKAEPNFEKSLELSANQAEVLNYLGYSWIDQGINLDKGMDMIRKAVELRPRSGFIVDSLGWAHYRLGKYEDAVRELERAVQLMPQDPTINDHLGDAYWKVGRKLEATFQWKIALASKTPPDDPAAIEAKLANGLVDEARAE